MTLPAAYFPVEPEPLRMTPRLRPLGTDFGNGPADALYFQRDNEFDRYRRAKQALGAEAPDRAFGLRSKSPAESEAHEAALSWAESTLAREHPELGPMPASPVQSAAERWKQLALSVQEDLILVQRDVDHTDRILAYHVCFPSSWRPEAILGCDFRAIHAPVPGFADRDAMAKSLVGAMIERGPYIRFVWTVSADDHLDHHPDRGQARPWHPGADRGWLRVERQVTVPLPTVSGAVFLIRTYLTAFDALEPEQLKTLARAVEQLPEPVRRYKNVDRKSVLAAIRAAPPAPPGPGTPPRA